MKIGMCKSLIFTEFSNIANQIAVKKSFRKQWPNGLYGIARTLNSASQPVKKRRALFSSVDSPSQGKRFLVQLVLFFSADNGDPVARGNSPFLCSFLDIEISKFPKDLLLFFFCHKLNLISGENLPLKETLSLQNHLFYVHWYVCSEWARGPHYLARFPSWDSFITPGY